MATFLSLYSGSSGNCTLVGEGGRYLCVDMGKSCRMTLNSLYEAGLSVAGLQGILVTHEHIDHVRGLRVFLKSYPLPVYGSGATLQYLAAHSLVPPGAQLVPLGPGVTELGGFGVQAFPTSHDAAGCRGFRVTTPAGRVAALATDLGCVTPAVLQGLSGADLVALEANYDPARLQAGPYPLYLKMRIASPRGHLSNEESAGTLARLLQAGCGRFALCHLSAENNTPDLARAAVCRAFAAAGAQPGRDLLLQVLRRSAPSPGIDF